jgi:putative peptidoglycan lipid II flippase
MIIGGLIVMVPKLDVNGVAVAVVVGAMAELVVLAIALAKRGLLPIPRWHTNIHETREVLRQYVPAASAALFMSGTAVVDNAMASWLGSGAVAALTYGNKIPALLAAAGMTALGTAVLPHFSRLVALGDHAAIRHTLRTYARWLLVVTVPGTLLVIVASESVVRVLFERGAFTPQDTALVTLIQQMYLIQIPFVMVGMLGVRLLVAMSKNYLLTIMAVINFAICVIGNLVFINWIGVSGIALSTSLMYMVSAGMIWVLVHRSLSRHI